jgi:hypothetical protein
MSLVFLRICILQVEVFWFVTPNSAGVGYQDGGSIDLWNVDILQHNTSSQARRPLLESSPP